MSSRVLGYSLLMVVIAACILPMIAPSQQPARTAITTLNEFRWEYKVLRTDGNVCASEAAFNSLGQQGWELVAQNHLVAPVPKEAEGTLLIVPAATGPNKDVSPPTADSFQGKITMQMGELQPGTCMAVFKRPWHPSNQP
jgi:hypothetical protein